jgi:hypothetical protein
VDGSCMSIESSSTIWHNMLQSRLALMRRRRTVS